MAQRNEIDLIEQRPGMKNKEEKQRSNRNMIQGLKTKTKTRRKGDSKRTVSSSSQADVIQFLNRAFPASFIPSAKDMQ
jgi:spore cortex formation protein SpoVR/YcgB (stage V sporulation)